MTALIWFRDDLRIADNPALNAAAESGKNVIALYILEDHFNWSVQGAAKWWLHHSLTALKEELQTKYNLPLTILRGNSVEVLPRFCEQHHISEIFWNRRYSEEQRANDKALKDILPKVTSFNGNLLNEPWQVQNKTGGFYKVFTPYWKMVQSMPYGQPLAEPKTLSPYADPIESLSVADLGLLPTAPNWATGFKEWTPGETGAWKRFMHFMKNGIKGYKDGRNIPAQENVSRLSPHLRFGELSPRQIFEETEKFRTAHGHDNDVLHFQSEVAWREFSYHLLYHLKDLPRIPLREEFNNFPWAQVEEKTLKKWQTGRTGYPIVDAGMRELWHTGYMHNRVRMIVASFLVKHLRYHWHHGEDWFWDTLLDADIGNNSASWQWVSGCGADASPYFRIFNPITQGEKFDPEGTYTKKWVPELKDVPKKLLFKPWEMSPMEQLTSGVKIGEDYPEPLVEHFKARELALSAYQSIKQ